MFLVGRATSDGLCVDPNFLDALARTNELGLFETQPVRLILQWKWEHYGVWAHMSQMLLYVAFVACFSTWLYHTTRTEECDTTTNALSVVSLVLLLPMLVTEFNQMRRSRHWAYFSSGWNWLELLSIVAVSTVIVLWWLDSAVFVSSLSDTGNTRAVLPMVVVLLVYMRLLTFLRGFKQTGALVAMLGAVMRDILPFLIILIVVILAFSASFYLLGVFDSPSDSIFSTFTMMIGEFYSDDPAGPLGGDGLARLLFFLYITIALIVMMNLLIAIISDTFERVIERQGAQFMKERANLLRDTETVLGGWLSVRSAPQPHKFLHVLMPEQKDGAMVGTIDGWSGRLRQMKDHVNQHMEKTKMQINEVKSDVNAQVDDVKAQVDDVKSQVDDVKSQVDDVKAQSDEILRKLDILLEKK